MRIVNRAHLPWFIFVVAATFFAIWLYIGNFTPQTLPSALRLPDSLLQKPSEYRRVGGTPLGLIFGQSHCRSSSSPLSSASEKKLCSGASAQCNAGCAPTFG